MAGIVGTHLVAQVGFIVKDVEAAKKKWAEFLGLEVPPTQPIGAYETTQTVYQGQPAPEAYCWMAFFDAGPGLQLELIQPTTNRPTGAAFWTSTARASTTSRSRSRTPKPVSPAPRRRASSWVQHGVYGDGSGEYNYLDAPDLKCVCRTAGKL